MCDLGLHKQAQIQQLMENDMRYGLQQVSEDWYLLTDLGAVVSHFVLQSRQNESANYGTLGGGDVPVSIQHCMSLMPILAISRIHWWSSLGSWLVSETYVVMKSYACRCYDIAWAMQQVVGAWLACVVVCGGGKNVEPEVLMIMCVRVQKNVAAKNRTREATVHTAIAPHLQ